MGFVAGLIIGLFGGGMIGVMLLAILQLNHTNDPGTEDGNRSGRCGDGEDADCTVEDGETTKSRTEIY